MKNIINTAHNGLYRLAIWSAYHPRRVLAIAVLVFVFSVVLTVSRLDFKTSRNDLVKSSDPAVERFKEISDDFGRLTNVIVVVEGNDLERMKQFATLLAARLKSEPKFFRNILYRLDTSTLEGKKLLFLSVKDLTALKKKLNDYGELIEELAFEPSVTTILNYVNQKISEATVSHLVSGFLGSDKESKNNAPKDPVDLSFLRSLLTEMRLSLGDNYRFHSPWDTFFKSSKKFSHDGFLVSDDERFLYITLEALSQKKSFTKKQESIKRLRQHIRDLRNGSFSDLQVGVTGGVALATDEMTQAMRDTKIATVVALIGIALLFIAVFRQVYNPLLVMVTLIISIGWTFGWLTLTVGSLNILSVTFAPILLGLGVDFGIHLIARYTEERDRGCECIDALHKSVYVTGKGVFLGALTTSLAFFALILARFRGIQELGFIAGSGVILSLIATFTVFPALLSMVERCVTNPVSRKLHINLDVPFAKKILTHYKFIEIACVVITLISLLFISRVYFDYNLLKLQAKGTESVVWEEKIIGESGRSSWFAVTTADNLNELRIKHERFENLPSVRKVDSLADLIPRLEDQKQRIKLVRSLAPLLPELDLKNLQPEPVNIGDIVDVLERIKFKLRSDTKWDPQKKPDEQEIASTRKALLDVLSALKHLSNLSEAEQKIANFEEKLFYDFKDKFTLLKNNVNPSGPIVESDIPPQLLARFKGKSGEYLIQVYSKKNIWEKENMETFVKQLKSVDPMVTGSPVVGYIAIKAMQSGYLEGSIYAFFVIFIVIIASFRNFLFSFYAMVPLIFTVLWTLGFMGLVRIPFNLANLIAMPLVLGIVVDDGIHIVHRYLEKNKKIEETIEGGMLRAISLTSWSTMIGFGSLMLAKHYGIFTLGVLVTISVGIAWGLSLFGLPAILKHVNQK